jgi:hypothetical protein
MNLELNETHENLELIIHLTDDNADFGENSLKPTRTRVSNLSQRATLYSILSCYLVSMLRAMLQENVISESLLHSTWNAINKPRSI